MIGIWGDRWIPDVCILNFEYAGEIPAFGCTHLQIHKALNRKGLIIYYNTILNF